MASPTDRSCLGADHEEKHREKENGQTEKARWTQATTLTLEHWPSSWLTSTAGTGTMRDGVPLREGFSFNPVARIVWQQLQNPMTRWSMLSLHGTCGTYHNFASKFEESSSSPTPISFLDGSLKREGFNLNAPCPFEETKARHNTNRC